LVVIRELFRYLIDTSCDMCLSCEENIFLIEV
jgi:hypothetical protein